MSRQGYFINNLSGYKSFNPSPLQEIEKLLNLDKETLNLIIEIHKNMTKINTMSELIPDSDLFLYSYVYKEALESSRIEGTECTMEDIFSNINKNRFEHGKNINDIKETISNIKAIEEGIKLLEHLPLCTRFFKEIHKVLLNNVRGENKNKGELRTTQNWIGGNNISNATFIPPNIDDMNVALNELDKYINNDKSDVDSLIKTALIHYQFETIHPFLDGNGRLGRIIILLHLIQEKILLKPNVYMSYFLKINQLEYYHRLMDVRLNDRYEEYIKFFLLCLRDTTTSVINKITSINDLHKKILSILPTTNRQKNSYEIVFNYIEQNPIFTIKEIQKEMKLSYNTVNTIVEYFKNLKILKLKDNVKRNRVYVYEEYIDLFKDV